ncbi:SDR family oxidoreductase [Stutzerimonas azotifigens]|uniref:SDR family oxidoreductase n=1 Tax=Stutzerimonas azotifigens TaxID=291995 RepID=UPI000423D1F2|nr:SDR family oxidoreductase [Stutzerimonas azotifigens]
MKPSLKPLREQVIVITGASSGIGLATARAAAEAGARVVLVSRNEPALAEIEQQLGGGDRLLHVAADVGKREDLERVAQQTIERFGGFDTWINNAGSSVWGRLDQVSDEDHHQVMQTNFWGTLYGSTIALAHLRDKGGAILNVGSVESEMALPFHASYSASKHAVKAMTDVLRIEVEQSQLPVSVTLIRPSSTDTLFMDHSKNCLDSAPTFPPPVYAPEVVARAILDAAERPQRDVYIGNAGFMTKLAQNFPALADLARRTFVYNTIQSGRPDSNPEGSLHNDRVGAGGEGQASGGYPGHTLKHSLYTTASQHPVATTAALLLGTATVFSLLGRKRH